MDNKHHDGPSLDLIEVASPCRANWADMTGDDVTRHCAQCDRQVHNLSSMTREEAEQFLQQSDDACIRLYRRYDGTILTSDCPVGALQRRSRMLRTLVALAAVIALLVVTPIYVIASPIRGWGKLDPIGRLQDWMKPPKACSPLQSPATATNPQPVVMGNMAMRPQPPRAPQAPVH